MIKPKIRSNLVYGASAFIFALILFFNANGPSIKSPISGSSTPESFEETVTNVRIEPYYDDEKYYVHGYNPTVSVKLSSVNRIQLNTEANADTRNFQVIADLTGLGEGNHEVKLRLQNMSSAVTGVIEPAKITVTIESRTTKTMEVEPVVSTSNLAEGFAIDSISVEPSEVAITTGSQTLAEIDRLVATVDPTKITDHNVEEKVRVQALDKEGNVLSIEAALAEVTVNVTVTSPQKQINLYTQQTGETAKGVQDYSFDLAETTAIISGTQESLDQIESLAVPVDITGISKRVTKKVHIPVSDGLAIEPAEVSVTITPRLTTSTSTFQSSEASQTPSSESQTGSSPDSESVDSSQESSDTTESSQESETSETDSSEDSLTFNEETTSSEQNLAMKVEETE